MLFEFENVYTCNCCHRPLQKTELKILIEHDFVVKIKNKYNTMNISFLVGQSIGWHFLWYHTQVSHSTRYTQHTMINN